MLSHTRRKFISFMAALPFVAAGASPARAGTLHKVSIAGFAFSPANLTIKAGDTVRWTNNDSAPHTADDAARKWKTGTLKGGKSGEVTFGAAGKFNYVCKFHPKMKGKISVT